MSLQEKLTRKCVDFGLIPIGKEPGAAVLMYHGVLEPGSEMINTRSISTAEFEQHLVGFKKYFHIATVKDIFDNNLPKDRFSIALSFDDGLRNNYTNALPLLKKHDVPATFFITGANEAGLPILWGELVNFAEKRSEITLDLEGDRAIKERSGKYKMEGSGMPLTHFIKEKGDEQTKDMLYAQLEELIEELKNDEKSHAIWQLMHDTEIKDAASSSLITIGSHGYAHLELGSIDKISARNDLERSKKYLDDLLDQNTDLLAYPSGSYNNATIETANELGLTKQFAVHYLHDKDKNDQNILNRYGVFSFPCTPRFFNYLITRH